MRALFLLAGQGTRLRPHTDNCPKCMVPLGGTPLLTTALDQLVEAGIREAVLVVGYLEDVLRAHYGERHGPMALRYVSNPRYATTNNLYSLFLAREAFDDDLLLLEGDLRFDGGILTRLLAAPGKDVAVVDRFTEAMDGTCVLPDRADPDQAERMVLGRDQGADFERERALKTVNIYKLSRGFSQEVFLPALSESVEASREGDYYEAVLARLVEAGTLKLSLLRAAPDRWAEIDDEGDLRAAEALFAA